MLLVTLVIIVVLFVFLAKLGGVLTARLSERFVASKFRAAESLLEEGSIPREWLEQTGRGSLGGHARTEDPDRRRVVLVRRLDKLIQYFEKCPFFDNEETKDLMLGRLREIAVSWRERDWAQR